MKVFTLGFGKRRMQFALWWGANFGFGFKHLPYYGYSQIGLGRACLYFRRVA
jgi:hypothetical protein